MTALHPLVDKIAARGVVASKYPVNETCAHPQCDKPTESRHHIFAASKIGNRSWFVALGDAKVARIGEKHYISDAAIPHVIGLCGTGTTGHHGDVEEHRAWIQLLPDGTFVWHDRVEPEVPSTTNTYEGPEWKEIGPLDPQPGSRIKHRRPKKARDVRKGDKRATERYTIAVPKDEQEKGAELLVEGLEAIEEKLGYDPPRSKYYTMMDAINFTLANADSTDVGP